MTQKIVINTCYGGFSLSQAGLERYKALTGLVPDSYGRDLERDDPVLVRVVEEGGASGGISSLKVIEIPEGVKWKIQEYDGAEWVAEAHRTWE